MCEKKLLEVIATSLGIETKSKPFPKQESQESSVSLFNKVKIQDKYKDAPHSSDSSLGKAEKAIDNDASIPSVTPTLVSSQLIEKLSRLYTVKNELLIRSYEKEEKTQTKDPWLVNMDNYNPKVYTSRSVLANLIADLDLIS